MTKIQLIEVALKVALYDAETSLRVPRDASGHWWLDLKTNARQIVIEWRPQQGFGVSLLTEDDSYGEGPDKTYTDVSETLANVLSLATTGKFLNDWNV